MQADVSDETLLDASRISLYDPHRPNWHMPLFIRHLNIVEGVELVLPVDSHDTDCLSEWKHRIARLYPFD